MSVFRFPVEISHPYLPDPAVNVWHIRTTGGEGDGTDLQRGVNAIHAFYESICGTGSKPHGLLQPGSVVRADVAREVGSDSVRTVDFAQVTGAGSGGMAPPSLSLCVNWLTNSATRRGRGRTFLGPLPSNSIEADGSVASTVLTAASAAVDDLIDLSTDSIGSGGGWAIGVYGLETAGGDRNSPHVLRDITRFKINDRFAWIRSRAR